MSLDSVISVASGALSNVSRHLAVVSQNVANAGTAGYAAETIDDTSSTAGGNGYGVRTGLATRTIDTALQSALNEQTGDVAGAQTRQAALAAIGVAQGNTAAGNDLASQVGALANAFTSLGTDPSNQVQQSAVVAAGAALATGINGQAAAYASARQAAQDSAVADVGTLNTALRAVGTLSDQIIAAKAGGQSTADLDSQRDAQETTAARLAGFKFLAQDNGDVLAVAGGLVANTRAASGPFSLAAAGLGAGSAGPALTLSGADVTAQLTGGSIGANLQLRDAVLPTAQAGLDEFAHTVATRFDNQGLRLFSATDGAVPTSTTPPAQSGYIGFSATIGVNPAVVAQPSLVRDGTQAVAAGTGSAAAFTPNQSDGPAGFATLIGRVLDFAFGADAQAGVSQAAPATTGLGAGGTISLTYGAGTTLAGFAANLVGAQSAAEAHAANTLGTAQALQTTLQTKLDSTSGVSVDTELSNMIALQNAYGANAKIITAAQSMWSDLLSSVTR